MEPVLQVVPMSPGAPELTIVVPSYNERDNIPVLFERIDATLRGVAWEMIVVDDDSPDGTWERVKELAQTDGRIRCIRRVGRRGLSGACIEGMLASASPVCAVMDADLQHDEILLPKMLAAIRGGAELAVGSRYVPGGSSGGGFSSIRKWGSETATRLARRMLKVTVNDPMSGFFMIRRDKVEDLAPKLSKEGFKILLDLVSAAETPMKTVEIPFTFRERLSGESKLDSLVTAEYLGLLFSKLSGGVLPVRFLMFAAVGGSGVFVHLAALAVLLDWFDDAGFDGAFEWAQFGATMVAMTWNFLLNNQLTYRDRRLKGFAFLTGLVTFYVVCFVGTIANVGVASWIHTSLTPSAFVAGLAGALMGSVFNYAASSVLTWRTK
jgi:dolichol-phosphate mannosyltransferase